MNTKEERSKAPKTQLKPVNNKPFEIKPGNDSSS